MIWVQKCPGKLPYVLIQWNIIKNLHEKYQISNQQPQKMFKINSHTLQLFYDLLIDQHSHNKPLELIRKVLRIKFQQQNWLLIREMIHDDIICVHWKFFNYASTKNNKEQCLFIIHKILWENKFIMKVKVSSAHKSF